MDVPLVKFWSSLKAKILAGLVVSGMLASLVSSMGLPAAFAGPPRLSQPTTQTQPLLLEKAVTDGDNPVNIIVQKSVRDDSVEQALQNLGGTYTGDLHIINAFSAKMPSSKIPELGKVPGVKWVSLDAPTLSTSSDIVCPGCIANPKPKNGFDELVKAPQVWNNSTLTGPWLQGQGVGVAVLDSGLNNDTGTLNVVANHKTNSSVANMSDSYGHGSLVAGVIGDNGTLSSGQYYGIAPKVNLINVKVSDNTGSSTASDVVSGLQWVNENKAAYNIRVVNISINSSLKQSYNVDPIDAAVEVLWFNGIVVVVSAGNNGTANLFPPANDPFVITVGAVYNNAPPLTPDNYVAAPFTAYGVDETNQSKPDLVAPGVGIITTSGKGNALLVTSHPDKMIGSTYMKVAGTSFAAPQVAGAAALLLQSEPNLNPDQVKFRLKATALQNLPRGTWDLRDRSFYKQYNSGKEGAGLLDIYAAVTNPGLNGTANTGLPASQLLWTGSTPVTWSSVNWSSVNWSSVNWSSVNWSSVNWSSVNWSSDNW